ncbi:MAG: 50S ribosomal protein L18 [Microgenomates group bacterium]
MKEKRYRLAVHRSNKYIYAQIIDDEKGETLVAASDLADLKKLGKKLTKTQKAREVGKILAKKALAKKIEKVFFDRRRYKYHGRVKALAEGAREGGLNF